MLAKQSFSVYFGRVLFAKIAGVVEIAMKSIIPSLYPSFWVVLLSKTPDCTSRCGGESTAALWLSVSDIQPQIYIVLAKQAILLTAELFRICCMITLMAFKQDRESTVIDNLEIAIDNQCLPLCRHIMSVDKTARKGDRPPFFKDQNESKWPGMGNDQWATNTFVHTSHFDWGSADIQEF